MATLEQNSSILHSLLSDAQRTEHESSSASDAATSVAMDVRMVSGMMGEMLRGISEVRSRVTESQQQAAQAHHGTELAVDRVSRLSSVVNEIGSTAKLVTRIAEETNMLALNATIEAARAGAAGACFAVVAKEVKALSRQTSLATADIHKHLASIRQANQEVIASVSVVRRQLETIQQLVTSVSDAVREQTQSVEAVSQYANQAADSVDSIASVLERIAAAARMTSEKMGSLESLVSVEAVESI